MRKGLVSLVLPLFMLMLGTAHAQPGKVTYVYTDPQGTPLAEADANGNITATFDYKPYGSQALGTPSAGPGYTGHINDPDTGLVYMQARYYDPVTERFLSIDPVGPSPGELFNFNRYDYSNNNPINHTDPDGRCVDGITCDPMVQAYGKWAAANPDQADKIGREVGLPGVSAMLSATGAGALVEAVNVVRLVRNTIEDSKTAPTTLQKNVTQGKAGEAATRAKYGDKIAGEQVTIKTSDGTRTRIDFVTKDKSVVETKTGNANLSTGQSKLFDDVNAGREVTPVGQNAARAGLEPGKPTTLKSCTIDRC